MITNNYVTELVLGSLEISSRENFLLLLHLALGKFLGQGQKTGLFFFFLPGISQESQVANIVLI